MFVEIFPSFEYFLAEMELLEEEKKKKDLGKTQEPATPEYAIGLTAPTEV